MLLLLDAPSMYFRAFHGVPETVTAPDGTPVNAVRGFLDALAWLVRARRPDRVVACFDADWRPAFRVAALAAYKAHRLAPGGGESVPPALAPQVPILEAVLDAVGIARLGVPGFEADDVIGTLATRESARTSEPVEIVTGDRDLFQLVRDADGEGGAGPIVVVYTARGIGRAEVVDEAAVTRRYGIPGRRYADYALLRGDPSDGLPGVAGIGEKAAAALVSRFGGLAELRAALDAGVVDGFPPGARRRLAAARDYLERAEVVVRVARDVPVPQELPDPLPCAPRDPEALVRLADRYGIDGPLNRLLGAVAA